MTYRGEPQKARTSQDILPLITKIMESSEELSDEEVVVEVTQASTRNKCVSCELPAAEHVISARLMWQAVVSFDAVLFCN